MKAGDICKVAFKQPEGSVKDRPVLLVKEVGSFGDWIVVPITSKLRNQDKELDILMDDTHSGFKATGLRTTSLIKLSILNTFNRTMIKGKIGELPFGILDEVYARLRGLFER
jgi:hypothetical protein